MNDAFLILSYKVEQEAVHIISYTLLSYYVQFWNAQISLKKMCHYR